MGKGEDLEKGRATSDYSTHKESRGKPSALTRQRCTSIHRSRRDELDGAWLQQEA